jgi:hypothetical protein
MDNETISILKKIGIILDEDTNLDDLFIPREQLINDFKYDEIKPLIVNLKNHYSSSFLTCLQKNASKSQKWPLLNLVRQILNAHKYKMKPVRKADGYTIDGVKKYKRFFHITKITNKNDENNKTNDDDFIDTQVS